MVSCYKCGFWDSDYEACTYPSSDMWYACPIESQKPENIKALEEYRMTLEEAIKHCEEVATENEKSIAYYTIQGDKEWLDECEKDCIECAKEHRQLAEWLRELKALNENDDVKDVFKNCDTCKYQSLEADDFPCDRCCHRYVNQYVYDNKREVNADDTNRCEN